ncbi:PKD domain-containing protein [Orenia marismortui]|uniref:PKD domain-containing protein n=1 Tax=Orenia marismortui TaxID=46469 RepID=UPI000375FAAF|nr:hypothetical protein [Orenia marismortui]
MIRKKPLLLCLVIIISILVGGCNVKEKANHAPVINLIKLDKNVVPLGEKLRLSVEASDIDQDQLNYKWVVDQGIITGKGKDIIYLPPEKEGIYQVRVLISDSKGHQVIANQEVTVKDFKIGIERERNNLHPGDSIKIYAKTNMETKGIVYSWEADGGEIIGKTNRVNYICPKEEGKYKIKLRVRNSEGIELEDSIEVNVKDYAPEILDNLSSNFSSIAINQDQKRGKAIFSVNARDLNGDKLNYNWQVNKGKIIGEGSKVTYLSPTYSTTDTIKVVISDDYGQEISQEADIKIIEVWQKSYGGISNDGFERVVRTEDGYLLVGYSNSFTRDWSYPAGYVVKINRQGKEEWYNYDYYLGGEDSFFGATIIDDGNYLLSGYKSNENNLSKDSYLVKINKNNGNKMSEIIGSNYKNQELYNLYQSSTKDNLGIGYINDSSNDGYLVKINAKGKQELEYTYDHDTKSGSNDYFESVVEGDNSYLLVGYTSRFDKSSGDGLVVKLDEKLNKLAEYTYGEDDLDERFQDVCQTEDGGYLLVGSIGSTESWVYDGYIVKIDSQGNQIFSHSYGNKKSDDGFRSVIATEDGGYLLVGYTNSAGKGDYDGYVVKINSKAKKEWSSRYGGIDHDEFMDASKTDDGGYLLIGYTSSFGKGERDGYIVKIDKEGNTSSIVY